VAGEIGVAGIAGAIVLLAITRLVGTDEGRIQSAPATGTYAADKDESSTSIPRRPGEPESVERAPSVEDAHRRD
jgi:hypothetical protein